MPWRLKGVPNHYYRALAASRKFGGDRFHRSHLMTAAGIEKVRKEDAAALVNLHTQLGWRARSVAYKDGYGVFVDYLWGNRRSPEGQVELEKRFPTSEAFSRWASVALLPQNMSAFPTAFPTSARVGIPRPPGLGTTEPAGKTAGAWARTARTRERQMVAKLASRRDRGEHYEEPTLAQLKRRIRQQRLMKGRDAETGDSRQRVLGEFDLDAPYRYREALPHPDFGRDSGVVTDDEDFRYAMWRGADLEASIDRPGHPFSAAPSLHGSWSPSDTPNPYIVPGAALVATRNTGDYNELLDHILIDKPADGSGWTHQPDPQPFRTIRFADSDGGVRVEVGCHNNGTCSTANIRGALAVITEKSAAARKNQGLTVSVMSPEFDSAMAEALRENDYEKASTLSRTADPMFSYEMSIETLLQPLKALPKDGRMAIIPLDAKWVEFHELDHWNRGFAGGHYGWDMMPRPHAQLLQGSPHDAGSASAVVRNSLPMKTDLELSREKSGGWASERSRLEKVKTSAMSDKSKEHHRKMLVKARKDTRKEAYVPGYSILIHGSGDE
jgi:hypothetical protein